MTMERATCASPQVTVENIDTLIKFDATRRWTSGVLFISACTYLAVSLLLYASDLEFWHILLRYSLVAYLVLLLAVAGYKASVPLSLTAGLLLVATTMPGLLSDFGLSDPVFVVADIVAVVLMVSVILYRNESFRMAGRKKFKQTPRPYLKTRPSLTTPATAGPIANTSLFMLDLSSDRPPARPSEMMAFAAKLQWLGAAALAVGALSFPLWNPVEEGFESLYLDAAWGSVIIASVLWVRTSFRRAKQMGTMRARELMNLDPRRPILILRAFKDDRIFVKRGALGYAATTSSKDARDLESHTSLEERIAQLLSRYGPVVALGMPYEEVPPLGASRDYSLNSEWQDSVGKQMDEAALIVVIAGKSNGLDLELQAVRDRGYLTKTIFVVPSVTTGTVVETETARERMESTLQAVGFHWNAEARQLERVRAFTVNAAGLTVLESNSESAAAVVEAAKALMSSVSGVASQNEVTPTLRQKVVEGLLGARPANIGLVTASIIVAVLPLLLITDFVTLAGSIPSTTFDSLIDKMWMFAIFNGCQAIGWGLLLCWLLKTHGPYVANAEAVEDLFKRLAVAVIPIVVMLLFVAVSSLALWTNRSNRFDGVIVLLVLISAVWAALRFGFALKQLWGAGTRSVVVHLLLAVFVCAALVVGARVAMSALTEPSESEAGSAEVTTQSSAANKIPEKSNTGHIGYLCRQFTPPDQNLEVWVSSLLPLEGEIVTPADRWYRMYCVHAPVPFWFLTKAEIRYRLHFH